MSDFSGHYVQPAIPNPTLGPKWLQLPFSDDSHLPILKNVKKKKTLFSEVDLWVTCNSLPWI